MHDLRRHAAIRQVIRAGLLVLPAWPAWSAPPSRGVHAHIIHRSLRCGCRDNILPANYKTCLCPLWEVGGAAVDVLYLCPVNPSTCLNLKSVKVLLLQSMGSCYRGVSCNFAHGQEELLPRMDPQATLCPIFQVTSALVLGADLMGGWSPKI